MFYFLSLTILVFRRKLTGTCQMRCGIWEIVIVEYRQTLYIFLHFMLQNSSFAFFILKKLTFGEMKLHTVRKQKGGVDIQDSKFLWLQRHCLFVHSTLMFTNSSVKSKVGLLSFITHVHNLLKIRHPTRTMGRLFTSNGLDRVFDNTWHKYVSSWSHLVSVMQHWTQRFSQIYFEMLYKIKHSSFWKIGITLR